jgi:hypothetical protein
MIPVNTVLFPQKQVKQPEVGAGAFFALSRSRARSQKKSAKARRKKSAKKSESAERERKKAVLFPLKLVEQLPGFQSNSPVMKAPASLQGISTLRRCGH